MNVLQINSSVNTGSTGRITEGIGRKLIASGHKSTIAYGRQGTSSSSKTIKIGNVWSIYIHGVKSLLLDRHGFGSRNATIQFVNEVEQLQPDAIGLHNLHGYYLNVEVLFKVLKTWNIPVIYTFHDCWPFTGHCTYYDSVNCEKWKIQCHDCPKTNKYPKSIGLDNSKANFIDKKRLFTSLEKLTIVTPSQWLANEAKQSFFKDVPIKVIHNGIDLNEFRPKFRKRNKAQSIILGVASTWDKRKGLQDIVKLRELLDETYKMVLIGLTEKQIKQLPTGIKGIQRTENIEELAEWYGRASVFINPTYQDNFPTTNIEALACGTPVVTYNTGGSPEAIDTQTGIVVEKGDIHSLSAAIDDLTNKDQQVIKQACRLRAEQYFNQDDRYREYVNLYETLIHESQLNTD